MNSPKEVDSLTTEERDLLEHYRQTTPGKRSHVLDLAEKYHSTFPVETPRLRLVAPK